MEEFSLLHHSGKDASQDVNPRLSSPRRATPPRETMEAEGDKEEGATHSSMGVSIFSLSAINKTPLISNLLTRRWDRMFSGYAGGGCVTERERGGGRAHTLRTMIRNHFLVNLNPLSPHRGRVSIS